MNNQSHSTNSDLEINSNDSSQEEATVKAIQVPDNQRIKTTTDFFGMHFPMKLEPAIYYFAEICAEHYHRLLDFACEHREAGSILRAID